MEETKAFNEKYQQYKSIVLKWENAFLKEKGRQPNKNDFSEAPNNVHIAYTNYMEIKGFVSKFTAKNRDISALQLEYCRSGNKIKSPRKIFERHGSSQNLMNSPSPKIFSSKFSMEGIKLLSPVKPNGMKLSGANLENIYHLNLRKSFPNPPIQIEQSGLTPMQSITDTVPFCKMNSKLSSDSETGMSNPVATVSQSGEERGPRDHVVGDNNFSSEMANVLQNVKKTAETFHIQNIGNSQMLSTVKLLDLDFGKGEVAIDTNAIKSKPSPNEPASPIGVDKFHKHDFFSKKSMKRKEVSKGWLDRCNKDDEDENIEAVITDKEHIDSSSVRSHKENVKGVTLEGKSRISQSSSELDDSSRSNESNCNEQVISESESGISQKEKEDSDIMTVIPSMTTRSRATQLVQAVKEVTLSKTKTKCQPPKRKTEHVVAEYDFVDDSAGYEGGPKKGRKRIRLTKKAMLEKKLNTGRVNDNFVRIDITKKLFVRGKRKMTGIQNKRLNWKLKKGQASAEAKIKLVKCRKCNEVGHFAKFCRKDIQTQDEPAETDDSPFPTLEEVTHMVSSRKASETAVNRTNVYTETKVASEQEKASDPVTEVNSPSEELDSFDYEPRLVLVSHEDTLSSSTNPSQSVDSESVSSSFLSTSTEEVEATVHRIKSVLPVFTEGYLQNDEAEILENGLRLFGYENFRQGQKEAITRVLRRESTLVVLSTGSGKSLCYQLPAYLYAKKYPGVLTLCVSPLVSLMEDQVQNLPPFMEGACLHTNMTLKQRELIIDKVRKKKLHILLVSPEAICGGLFGLFRNLEEFPPVAFACVDEVHCVSEWSHNFRPSYLKLCKILREKLNIETILGLTATATSHTIKSVCDHLRMDPSSSIRGEIIPQNLRLSCSRDLNREEALLTLLRSQRFEDCDSIIIYCTRREQCEKIAILLRTALPPKAIGIVKHNRRSRISTECETYHAGMSAARRKAVQTHFMSGLIRIVVATVAFGMGIDKSDIRAVIHYNMPKTFESYVQEIGRSGRDGLPAECHLFLDNNKGKDICELKRHIYANSVDRATLRKLLGWIFNMRMCSCSKQVRTVETTKTKKMFCTSEHEISFSVEKTIQKLDLPDENIETLLCYLELNTKMRTIRMLPKCYHQCTIQSYGGTKLLKAAARKCPSLAAAIAIQREKKKFKDDDVHIEFNFIEIATALDWNSSVVRKELKSLEWTGTQFDELGNPNRFRKSGLLVEFTDLAYRMIVPGSLLDEELDALLNFLHERNLDQMRTELYQLHHVYQSLYSNSHKTVDSVCELFDVEKSDNLKQIILDYFNQSEVGVPSGWKPVTVTGNETEKEETIRQDIRNLLHYHGDNEFTSRSIAKIFQGISSPCFPAENWFRNKAFWRRHLDVEFDVLCQIAAKEIGKSSRWFIWRCGWLLFVSLVTSI